MASITNYFDSASLICDHSAKTPPPPPCLRAITTTHPPQHTQHTSQSDKYLTRNMRFEDVFCYISFVPTLLYLSFSLFYSRFSLGTEVLSIKSTLSLSLSLSHTLYPHTHTGTYTTNDKFDLPLSLFTSSFPPSLPLSLPTLCLLQYSLRPSLTF